jgi:hypothetical protein
MSTGWRGRRFALGAGGEGARESAQSVTNDEGVRAERGVSGCVGGDAMGDDGVLLASEDVVDAVRLSSPHPGPLPQAGEGANAFSRLREEVGGEAGRMRGSAVLTMAVRRRRRSWPARFPFRAEYRGC